MIFTETRLSGAYLVDLQPREDERGFNARVWCAREFAERGLRASIAQVNLISNRKRGTLRGLHYQAPPRAESKLFQCVRGSVYDVIVDLRSGSATYGQWFGIELRADPRRLLYIPECFAQGFQTLEDDTEVLYLVSEFYAPTHERGIRHDDSALGITWPLEVSVISAKDRAWPALSRLEPEPTL